jgi:hypothetical protein
VVYDSRIFNAVEEKKARIKVRIRRDDECVFPVIKSSVNINGHIVYVASLSSPGRLVHVRPNLVTVDEEPQVRASGEGCWDVVDDTVNICSRACHNISTLDMMCSRMDVPLNVTETLWGMVSFANIVVSFHEPPDVRAASGRTKQSWHVNPSCQLSSGEYSGILPVEESPLTLLMVTFTPGMSDKEK